MSGKTFLNISIAIHSCRTVGSLDLLSFNPPFRQLHRRCTTCTEVQEHSEFSSPNRLDEPTRSIGGPVVSSMATSHLWSSLFLLTCLIAPLLCSTQSHPPTYHPHKTSKQPQIPSWMKFTSSATVTIAVGTLATLVSTSSAGPLAYAACQAGCFGVAVACYNAAGFVFGTVAAPAAPPAILACNSSLGTCCSVCAGIALVPAP